MVRESVQPDSCKEKFLALFTLSDCSLAPFALPVPFNVGVVSRPRIDHRMAGTLAADKAAKAAVDGGV